MIKKKIKKIIIRSIVTVLTLLMAYGMVLKITPDKKKNVVDNTPQQSTQEIKTIKDETIIKQLNLINSLNCLDGTVNTKITFSNEDIVDNDVNFQWLKESFSKMTSKEITIDSNFRFTFAYDLEDMPVEGNTIYISENRLKILSVELINNDSIYSERVGILEKKFSPQELNSLNYRVKQYAYNTIQSKTELREKALKNVKTNLEKLIPNVKIKLGEINFVENNDISIKSFKINE